MAADAKRNQSRAHCAVPVGWTFPHARRAAKLFRTTQSFPGFGRNIPALTIIHISHSFTFRDSRAMTTTTIYHYPNRMGRIILLSMEEVMGRNGVNAVLNLASLSALVENYPPDNTSLRFPFSTVSNITAGLEHAYGPHGGRGLALRVGRACFNYGVRQYSTQLGLTQMAFRLLPLPLKLSTGARALA